MFEIFGESMFSWKDSTSLLYVTHDISRVSSVKNENAPVYAFWQIIDEQKEWDRS